MKQAKNDKHVRSRLPQRVSLSGEKHQYIVSMMRAIREGPVSSREQRTH